MLFVINRNGTEILKTVQDWKVVLKMPTLISLLQEASFSAR